VTFVGFSTFVTEWETNAEQAGPDRCSGWLQHQYNVSPTLSENRPPMR
jgi:hypothetical protein